MLRQYCLDGQHRDSIIVEREGVKRASSEKRASSIEGVVVIEGSSGMERA